MESVEGLLCIVLLLLFHLLVFPKTIYTRVLSLPSDLVASSGMCGCAFSSFSGTRRIVRRLEGQGSLSVFQVSIIRNSLCFGINRCCGTLGFCGHTLSDSSIHGGSGGCVRRIRHVVSYCSYLRGRGGGSLCICLLLGETRRYKSGTVRSITLFGVNGVLCCRNGGRGKCRCLRRTVRVVSGASCQCGCSGLHCSCGALLVFRGSSEHGRRTLEALTTLRGIIARRANDRAPVRKLDTGRGGTVCTRCTIILFQLKRTRRTRHCCQGFLTTDRRCGHSSCLVVPCLFSEGVCSRIVQVGTTHRGVCVVQKSAIGCCVAAVGESLK